MKWLTALVAALEAMLALARCALRAMAAQPLPVVAGATVGALAAAAAKFVS